MKNRYDDRLLKCDSRARAEAIREVLSVFPGASVNDLTGHCLKANIPTRFDEVRALRNQYRKVSASVLPPAVRASVMTSLPDASFEETYARTLAEVGGALRSSEVDFKRKLHVAPLPPAVQLAQLQLDKLAIAPFERARKAKASLEREAARVEKEITELNDTEKRMRAGLTPLAAEKPRLAETAPLPDAVAQRFSDKLEGRSSELPDLPPELEIGKQDTPEGSRVRLRWVEDLFLQKPQLTSTDAYLLMQATFGIGIGNGLIVEALKAVRELNGMRFITRRRSEQPVIEVAAPPLAKRVVHPDTDVFFVRDITPPGAPRKVWELVGNATVGTMNAALTELAQLGVDTSALISTRPMKVKMAIQVVTTVTAEVDDE